MPSYDFIIFSSIIIWHLWQMKCNFLMFNVSIPVVMEIFRQTNKQMIWYGPDLLLVHVESWAVRQNCGVRQPCMIHRQQSYGLRENMVQVLGITSFTMQNEAWIAIWLCILTLKLYQANHMFKFMQLLKIFSVYINDYWIHYVIALMTLNCPHIYFFFQCKDGILPV